MAFEPLEHVQGYYKALSAGNADDVASFFTDDATHYYTRLGPHHGREIADNAALGVEHLDAEWIYEHGITDGNEAVLALRRARADPEALAVALRFRPFLHPKWPLLRVEIWANRHRVADWTLQAGERQPRWRRLVVPAEALAGADTLTLAFVIRNPGRPIALGLSDDRRRLGLFLQEFCFGEAAAAVR